MLITGYQIIRAESQEPYIAMRELVDAIKRHERVVGVTIFTNHYDRPQATEVFLQHYGTVHVPPITFVSQQPFDTCMAAEVITAAEDAEVAYRQEHGVKYSVTRKGEVRSVHIEGVSGRGENTYERSRSAFAKLERTLAVEKLSMGDMVRQWSYLEGITEQDGSGGQVHHIFNSVREEQFDKAEWLFGLPADTCIGMNRGGVLLSCIALDGNYAIDAIGNPRQDSPQSQRLETNENGDSAPTVERAKSLIHGHNEKVFLSATATIEGDIEKQTHLTIDELERLLERAQRSEHGHPHYETFRAYIKQADDFPIVQGIVSERFPEAEVLYLHADVWRPELLVEIEGIATTQTPLP